MLVNWSLLQTRMTPEDPGKTEEAADGGQDVVARDPKPPVKDE
jgi:hypothetical protein